MWRPNGTTISETETRPNSGLFYISNRIDIIGVGRAICPIVFEDSREGTYVIIGGILFLVTITGLVRADDDGNPFPANITLSHFIPLCGPCHADRSASLPLG